MKGPSPRRGWVNRGLCALAMLLCLGGVAFCFWVLHILGSLPDLHDPLLEPELVRCILSSPADFVRTIGFESDGTRHMFGAAASFLEGLANQVLAQLFFLVLVWLTLPRGWTVPGSPALRRFHAWLARSGATTACTERLPPLPTVRALAWSGRQVTGAAILLGVIVFILAKLGNHIALGATTALLHPLEEITWGVPPDAARVLAANVEAYGRWQRTRLGAELAIAVLLGLQLLAVALLLPLLRRGGGVVAATIDETSPRRQAAAREGAILPPLALSLLRTFGKLGLLILVLLAALPAAEWSLEPVLYAHARSRMVRRFGALTPSRFRSRRASQEARMAALDLISAAAVVRLVGSESPRLRKALELSTAAAPLPDGAAVRLILARNAALLDVAAGVAAGPAPALDIDYYASEGAFPFSSLEQVVLTRLLYLDGAAAAVDGDQRRYEAALSSLGAQAAMLTREPSTMALVLGLFAEKSQLRLLELLVERGATLSATAWRPVAVDLERSYFEVTALHAWLLERELMAAMTENPVPGTGRDSPNLDVEVIRRISPSLFGAAGRQATAYAAFASGLAWTETFADAYPRPFGAMRRELEPRVSTLTFRGRLGYMLAPPWADLAAQVRLLAEARELARCAMELRRRPPSAGSCEVAAAPFVESRRIANGCLLVSRNAQVAVKAFAVRHPPPLEWRIPLAPRSP